MRFHSTLCFNPKKIIMITKAFRGTPSKRFRGSPTALKSGGRGRLGEPATLRSPRAVLCKAPRFARASASAAGRAADRRRGKVRRRHPELDGLARLRALKRSALIFRTAQRPCGSTEDDGRTCAPAGTANCTKRPSASCTCIISPGSTWARGEHLIP